MGFGMISLFCQEEVIYIMKKVNLLYDATIVCNIMAKNSSRSGNFPALQCGRFAEDDSGRGAGKD